MSLDTKIAIIGLGKMGSTLVRAFLARHVCPRSQLAGSTGHEETAKAMSESLGIRVVADNLRAIEGADLVILGVKPQKIEHVLNEIRPAIAPHQIVVSLAAASSLHFLESHLNKGVPVIRAMPNLPCEVGEGMTVLCPGSQVLAEQMEEVQRVFASVGRVAAIDNQDLMDGVTALSGSGPAYGYIIIESLAEGGVKVGLPRSLATTLAAQAILGAAAMVLETGEHPAKLKDMVTTPAGTTVDGLMALEEGSLRVALIKAVDAATTKARELFRGEH